LHLSRESLTGSRSSSSSNEDGFGLLKNLPAEQLELLANCDIRYSLPSQGLPAVPTAAVTQQLGLKLPQQTPPHHHQRRAVVKPVSKHFEVRPLHPPPVTNIPAVNSSCSPKAVVTQASAAKSWPLCGSSNVPSSEPDRLAHVRNLMRGEQGPWSSGTSGAMPGSYSHIFLRFYEEFVQLTLAVPSARLTGSLSPPGRHREDALFARLNSFRLVVPHLQKSVYDT
jgi:hypothetical protein